MVSPELDHEPPPASSTQVQPAGLRLEPGPASKLQIQLA